MIYFNQLYEKDVQKDFKLIDKRLNYLEYEGNFKNGKLEGEANCFSYPDIKVEYDIKSDSESNIEHDKKHQETAILASMIDNDSDVFPNSINIRTGYFKGEKLNGYGKVYALGYLVYEGEFKDGILNGDGIQYFPKSKKVKYKGKFKNGKYDGKGTKYSENGEIIYSGNWENGDYKS